MNRTAEENPATAHMFIVNPLHGQSFDSLFSTHPRMEERIRRLMSMEQEASFTASVRTGPSSPKRASTSSVPDSGKRPTNTPKGP